MGAKRKISEGDIYHIMARGTGRQLIYECDEDREVFLRILKKAITSKHVELYAWCLMGDHYHLLVHAPLPQSSSMVHLLNGAYARWFNDKRGRVGHLFQGRFKSEPVNDDAYLMTVIRYIHRNPDSIGVDWAESYPWSSYKEYFGTGGLCSTQFPQRVFGSQKAFVDFHKDWNRCDGCLDVDAPRNATRSMPDEMAIKLAEDVIGEMDLANLKIFDVKTRNAYLKKLRQAGLSVRQLERLTGIGRGAIEKASRS